MRLPKKIDVMCRTPQMLVRVTVDADMHPADVGSMLRMESIKTAKCIEDQLFNQLRDTYRYESERLKMEEDAM